MRKKAALSNRLFRAVCLSFAIVMLLLTLYFNIGILRADEKAAQLEQNIVQLRRENEVLSVRLENRISLEEIERIAVDELGMHRPGAEQLYFDMLPG